MDSGQIDQQLAQDLEVKLKTSFMAISNESIITALNVVCFDYPESQVDCTIHWWKKLNELFISAGAPERQDSTGNIPEEWDVLGHVCRLNVCQVWWQDGELYRELCGEICGHRCSDPKTLSGETVNGTDVIMALEAEDLRMNLSHFDMRHYYEYLWAI